MPRSTDVAGEPGLLRDRVDAEKRADAVLAKRNAALVDLGDEATLSPQAREFQREAARIERTAERHELIFGAAAHQRRHDLQQANASVIA